MFIVWPLLAASNACSAFKKKLVAHNYRCQFPAEMDKGRRRSGTHERNENGRPPPERKKIRRKKSFVFVKMSATAGLTFIIYGGGVCECVCVCRSLTHRTWQTTTTTTTTHTKQFLFAIRSETSMATWRQL